jgi:hypothetical protein
MVVYSGKLRLIGYLMVGCTLQSGPFLCACVCVEGGGGILIYSVPTFSSDVMFYLNVCSHILPTYESNLHCGWSWII